MPLQRYGVLKGSVVDARREDDSDTPHYQVHVRADDTSYRIAVNVKSMMNPSELLFIVDDRFQHPVTAGLPGLPNGFTALQGGPGSLALDFIRGNLFDRQLLRPIPHNLPGADNDLSDRVEHYVGRAKGEHGSEVYAFGERWGPELDQRDKIFEFVPGNGIHDIHMNQGNHPQFARDDGVWQDGALVFRFPQAEQWVAVFLAFQSQAWHTDDSHRTRHHGTRTCAWPDRPRSGRANRGGVGEPDRSCSRARDCHTTQHLAQPGRTSRSGRSQTGRRTSKP